MGISIEDRSALVQTKIRTGLYSPDRPGLNSGESSYDDGEYSCLGSQERLLWQVGYRRRAQKNGRLVQTEKGGKEFCCRFSWLVICRARDQSGLHHDPLHRVQIRHAHFARHRHVCRDGICRFLHRRLGLRRVGFHFRS